MALVINTNIASLQAQNNLVSSQNALNQATERLSSGLKINSAADNAAGYAIANRYTTQIGGLQQASSNASDAINLAQTAGSALDQVTSNLNAIRDLAVQAANGTYSATDRASMNQEVQQRLSEITRIANQTTFNNANVLNGALGNTTFQVGANVGQTISVNLQTNVQAAAMGGIAAFDSGNLSGAFVTSGGVATGLSLSGVTIGFTGTNGTTGSITLSGTATSAQSLADAINSQTSGAVNAAVDGNGGINIFSSVTNTSISVAGGSFDANAVASGSSLTTNATSGGVAGIASGAYTSGTAISAATSGSTGMLANGDVLTVSDANALISQVDSALSTVSDFATQLGAVQNRFQSTISTLSAQTTNLQASQSTIQDADFAAETAALSQASVLQQAGISVLAQANSNPQMALKLLQ
ncbi:flagellin [Rhodanobacter sp. DHB23]|uniref:flagellin N-terminal helical domain-containing protein n=1 Tax=Rhodanobacter sp. DHB23 TaxID=2775923 RepID=UPI001782BBE9|nr:flagellin [Rhodanobacter sp. DHB23]MBD8871246.1 flagellin/flagellar hook associated protein [Rhodanobacter sp. DHB23]